MDLFAGRTDLSPSEDEQIHVLIDEELYEFHGPERGRSPDIQVVFFHGLEPGDSSKAYEETWKSFDGSVLWPKWLAEEFRNARILSVSYDSSLIRGRKMGRLDLYLIAENVIQNLADESVGMATEEGCPLFLVGKDLGCLVIEAVCVRAKAREMSSFLSNLKGLCFYCPPLMGVPEFSGRFDGELAPKLRWGDAEISRLNCDFLKLKQKEKWLLKVTNAAYPAPGREAVSHVREASARLGADDFYSANEDIRSICRPRNNTAHSFKYLRKLISDCLKAKIQHRTKARIKMRVPFVYDHRYVPLKGTIEKIRSSLKMNRIVVLHGDAGSGKSSLVRSLALQFQEESRLDAVSWFPDGIHFLPCGFGADVVSMQDQLLRLVNSRHHETFKFDFLDRTSRESADSRGESLGQILVDELVKHLGPLQALLIVDDVWDQRVLEGLVVPGNVKYVVTTQDPMLSRNFSDSKAIKIEPLQREVAHQILANYAGIDGGAIPSYLEVVADNLLRKTVSNPLSLATLGMAVNENRKHSLDEWLRLEDRFLDSLKEDYYTPSLHGRKYHSSVLASMMLPVGGLDEDVRKLLYVIVIFEGPVIDESLLQLFLDYVHEDDNLKGVDASSIMNKLRDRGLVEISWREPLMAKGAKGRSEWSIHSLRRHAILTLNTEEISKVTKFLDGKFLDGGIRSHRDLATTLCAIFGESSCQQRAAKMMGSSYIWAQKEFANIKKVHFTRSLRHLIFVMLVERSLTVDKYEASNSAEEVFWKLLTMCKLDGARITCLLDLPYCLYWTSSFLSWINSAFLSSEFRFSLESSDTLVTKLLYLTSPEGVHDVEETEAPFPSWGLFFLIQVSVIWLSTLAAIDCMPDGPSNPLALEDIPPGLKRYGQCAADAEPRTQLRAANAIRNVGFSIRNLCLTVRNLGFTPTASLTVPQVQVCLKRIVDLFPADLDMEIRRWAANAIQRLASVPAIAVIIAQDPLCLTGLAGLLVEDVKYEIQKEALGALFMLASTPATLAQVPLILERLLFSLIEENLEPDKRFFVLAVIAKLSFKSANLVAISQFPRGLERLVRLLAADMELNTQKVAGMTICNLALKTEIVMTIAKFPLCLERLASFLGLDVEYHLKKRSFITLIFVGHCYQDQGRVEVGVTSWDRRGDVLCNSAVQGVDYSRSHSSTVSIRAEICRLVMEAGGPEDACVRLFRTWSVGDVDRKDFQSAFSAVNSAWEIDKNYCLLWLERGVLLRFMGDLSGALEDLNKVLETFPDWYEPLMHRALVKHLLKDYWGSAVDRGRAMRIRRERVDDEDICCLGEFPVRFFRTYA